jgi:hypothetical protein
MDPKCTACFCSNYMRSSSPIQRKPRGQKSSSKEPTPNKTKNFKAVSVDYSHQKINASQISEVGMVKHFNAAETTFQDESNLKFTKELKALVSRSCEVLKSFECQGSNLKGVVFYNGKEVEVDESKDKLVGIEGKKQDEIPIVRDEDVEKKVMIEHEWFYHIRTSWNEDSLQFVRSYTLVDWLSQLTKVNLSGTEIATDGIVSIIAGVFCNL